MKMDRVTRIKSYSSQSLIKQSEDYGEYRGNNMKDEWLNGRKEMKSMVLGYVIMVWDV
jgi:hypothetical protein